MNLGFSKKFPWGNKTNFEDKILNGIKIHTFREDKKGRWTPGKLIHFATGIRTKLYNCFKKGVCKSVQDAKINHYSTRYGYPDVIIDGKLLSDPQVSILSKNDGFDSVDDFFKWFNKDFQGRLIHWTDFKY